MNQNREAFTVFAFFLISCLLFMSYLLEHHSAVRETCLLASGTGLTEDCRNRLIRSSDTVRGLEWLMVALGATVILLGAYMMVLLDQQARHLRLLHQWLGAESQDSADEIV